jgi:hypothetical protein
MVYCIKGVPNGTSRITEDRFTTAATPGREW